MGSTERISSLSSGEVALIVAMLGAIVTLLVAVIGAWLSFVGTKNERRRELFSDSVKAALAWEELLYRIRRRSKDNSMEIVELFHTTQSDLSYYRAWIGSESRYLRRSYDHLVSSVKSETADLIRSAWLEEPRGAPWESYETDVRPDLDGHVDRFLCDVRGFLSPLFPRKLAVVWRNRKGR